MSELIKVCRVCGVVRSERELRFIGESCSCPIPQFEDFEKDESKLIRL